MLEGDEKPPTLSGVGAAPRQPSAQGGGSLQGIDVPMHGLPRGRVAVIAAGTGALCLALGAALAYRAPTVPETIPVTPVGLIGEPAAVVPVRTVEPGASTQRPSTGGRNTAARTNTAARPNTGSAAGNTNTGSAAGNTSTGSAAGSTNTGSAAGNTNTGSAAGTNTSAHQHRQRREHQHRQRRRQHQHGQRRGQHQHGQRRVASRRERRDRARAAGLDGRLSPR
ncbi:MAG: hypothetical protein R3A48_27505 [Polyangiales bacterium]